MGKGISWLVCTGEGKAYDVVLPFGDGSTAVTVHEVTAVSLTF